ncbi:MAG: TetR/AcrR family transcriptional regulator [Actinomycetota bacterium]
MTTSPPAAAPAVIAEGRSARKRRQILEAATTVFLQRGYLGTSMDEIATLAGVSKKTVYSHFSDKRDLFVQIVLGSVDAAADPTFLEVVDLETSADVEADLRDVARRMLARVIQPKMMRLRRLVISEAERFPELGRTFYQRGPGRTHDALAQAFDRLAQRGILQIDDPRLAAEHFSWLIMSIPVNRAMLLGEGGPLTAADLDRYAHTGVAIFLGAFGRRS